MLNRVQQQLSKRDPRRIRPLVDWILALPLEFNGDSAFESTLVLAALKYSH